MREKNEILSQKGFNVLIIDYEFKADNTLPAYCSGRVLCDGWYKCGWIAETREQAIEQFLHNDLKEVY